MESFTSMVEQYDEIIRCSNVLIDSVNLEERFLRHLVANQNHIQKYAEATDECKRLQVRVDSSDKDISVLENKLSSARRWLDAERQLRKRVEAERDALSQHLDEARCILLNDPRYKLSEETQKKLAFLNKAAAESCVNSWRPISNDRLNTITETDSMSEMSFSRSLDDLDDDMLSRPSNKHRSSFMDDESAVRKKRKSCENQCIPDAPCPEVYIASPPREKSSNYVVTKPSAVERINSRVHNYVTKTYIMPESCSWCSKKIGFGKMVFKCLDCQAVAHTECYEKIPLPCIPMGSSPKKGGSGLISDYAPSTSPMIPALVIHCINEVERRGLNELGIYRMSGTESVMRTLREKFTKGKGAPCLTDIDIHTVCCFLKDFLRNLQDSLIPRNKWSAFAETIDMADKEEKLHDLIVKLPQANRDTLAFLIVHLKNVAVAPECRMPISSLATVFGPTVVGYSNSEAMSALTDAHTSNAVMEALLLLPTDYWSNFISPGYEQKSTHSAVLTTPNLCTPHRKTPRKLMRTPGSTRKFFNTSPPLH